ncbi:MAG TPA: F0F1 ATP synthase subunit gamma [Acidimicrobiales bacterium]|nr:F0F1 ATP synthase subunit gamma [Acidimicrobiales bacterium]
MAGGEERVLRRRIKSVQSTKKITKAMELIAASRIVKAQQRVVAARPYSDQILNVLHNLSTGGAASVNPLLNPRPDEEVRTVEYVVLAGDRGLCGGFNTGNIRMAEVAINHERAAGRDVVLVTVGKKAQSYFRFRKYAIAAAINGVMDRPSYEDARRVAAEVLPRFEAGEVQRVQLVYTEFLSASSQRVVNRRFLPLDAEAMGLVGAPETHDGPTADYEYEPDPTEILDALLPRYVEARLFGALLASSASFFAAQQRAMAAASENADELITKLTRRRNRARQDAITTEIMEIVGGAEALSQK